MPVFRALVKDNFSRNEVILLVATPDNVIQSKTAKHFLHLLKSVKLLNVCELVKLFSAGFALLIEPNGNSTRKQTQPSKLV